ncbi:MAG: FAD-binding oxidoreductase [Woeseiaceae bacterium]|nr:FAD-binding oxidoreductase [Woeseiaceae bacterium]
MTDVIVIGGGIAGCSTAMFLAEDGADVLLLERGDLNAQASGLNAGSLHAQIQHEPFVEYGEDWVRDYLPALPFYRYAIDTWEQLSNTLDDDLEFVRNGGIIVAATDEQMRQVEAKTKYEAESGLGTELLDAAALNDLAPYISDAMIGGAFCPLEGKASPLNSTTALAAAATSAGARLRRDSEVLGIERNGSGFRVSTTDGRFEAPRLVNAAGVDAGRIAELVGVRLDIQAFPIQLSVTEPTTPLIRHLLYSAADMLTLKQSQAGTILIGGGWPAEPGPQGRPSVNIDSLAANLALAAEVVPDIDRARLVRSWAGVVNGTHDWLPILGEAPGVPGFFINYVPWMGFTGGPASGRIVASQVQGKAPPVDFDLAPFAPAT